MDGLARTGTAALAVGMAILPALGSASPAHAASGPVTITGDYTLTGNIAFNDTAFIIAADNVTLDLNGYTITGPSLVCNPCPPADGVLVQGHSGVTVKNGTITGFVFGVRLDGADANAVKNVTVTNSSLNGISLFNDADNNRVEDCTVTGGALGGAGFGITMNNNSDGNSVRNCTVANNRSTGMFIGGTPAPSRGNTVEGNLVSGNLNNGIQINNAHNNVIRNNTFKNNGARGMLLTNGSSGNELRSNTVLNNTRDGLFVSAAATPPLNNLIAQNTLLGNGLPASTDRDIRDLTAGAGTLGTGNTYLGSVCDTSTPAGLCAPADAIAPVTTAAQTPAPNAALWNNSAVTVTISAADNPGGSGVRDISVSLSGAQSGASVTAGNAASVTLAAEGVTTVTYFATDHAGNTEAAKTLTVRLDVTAPTVTYTGNAGTYTVSETVAITCAAADERSGLASHTCNDLTGPAYAFSLGANSFSASAVDVAGNTGSGSTSFTVRATYDSVCALAEQFSTKQGVAHSLCVKLQNAQAAEAKGNLHAKAGLLGAFKQEAAAQSGKALTAAQAALLATFADHL